MDGKLYGIDKVKLLTPRFSASELGSPSNLTYISTGISFYFFVIIFLGFLLLRNFEIQFHNIKEFIAHCSINLITDDFKSVF